MADDYKTLGKVVRKIDGFSFVVNRGSEHEFQLGQSFLVFTLGKDITDPDTGENLGTLEVVRGRARAVHVQEKISTLKSSEKETTPGIIEENPAGGGMGVFPFSSVPSVEEIEEGRKTQDMPIDVQVGEMIRPI